MKEIQILTAAVFRRVILQNLTEQSGSRLWFCCVSVGRQTTAPAAVSAVAGTTAGIVEQGNPAPSRL